LISRIVVPAGHLKKLIQSYGVRTPIEVIPNGIDPEDISLSPTQRSLSARRLAPLLEGLAGRRILIYVGRIAREKNIDFLLRSLEHVWLESPRAVLLLVGDGPYRKELQRRVTGQGRGNQVRFTGYLDRCSVAYLLSISDLFVFASRTEVHPLVLIEAMSCGTPIIAVNARGTDEILDGVCGGELVPENHEIFAQRVSALLADKALRQQRSAEARKAAQSLNLRHMAERTLSLYRRLLQEKEATARVEWSPGPPAQGR
jgi:glycosyltransferase involved in cell wall biosynthesis